MPLLKDYRIFISHAWKYGDDYDRLIRLLNNAPNFSYYNYSAPIEKPLFPTGTPLNNSMIATKITEKMRPAQVVLVISGMYTAYSSWMQYEINEAVRMGKPIIGIVPYGALMTPSQVSSRANKLVHWNTASIVSAIRQYSL